MNWDSVEDNWSSSRGRTQKPSATGTLGLAGCAVMTSSFAVTADSGWYGGLGIGQSRAKIDDARITSGLLGSTPATTSMDDDDRKIGYKRSGGHRYNKNLALEAGHFNLGKFGFTATTVPAGTLSDNIELKDLNPDAVGIVSITEKFSAFGRVGLNYADAKDFFTGTGLVKMPSA